MRLRHLCALSLAAATLGGCAGRQTLDCSGGGNTCAGPFEDCEPLPDACRDLPPGVSYGLVEIATSPTPASLYVDGQLVGRAPLRYPLYFTNETRYVSVVAEPLYPNQTRQERRIRVPPLPDRIQFFMNNPAADDASDEAVR
jgi:hypothetical protein